MADSEPFPAFGDVDDFRSLWSLQRFRDNASASLPSEIWDFIEGGSGTEQTLSSNESAWGALGLVPRVLQDVSHPRGQVNLLGDRFSAPIGVAPIAYHDLFASEGEVATARASADTGLPFAVSTFSSRTFEEVGHWHDRWWLQLYPLRDLGFRAEFIERARANGCKGILVTVDVPWMGLRSRDLRNRFSPSGRTKAANLGSLAATAGETVIDHTKSLLASSFGWPDLESFLNTSSLPVVVKGVLDPDDAVRAVSVGAAGIIVSNHGGRQLDGAAASARCLPAVVERVGGRGLVMVDGGVRSGVDVLRGLALGADAVLVGRPVMWGLACGGYQGAKCVLERLTKELSDALGLAGCCNVQEARELRVL